MRLLVRGAGRRRGRRSLGLWFPAGDFPDLEIFTLGLADELVEGEKVEVDEGYTGDLPIRPKSDFGGNVDWRNMKGKARARHMCFVVELA